jgi:tRNA G18 (ribose-2'-O)-methylase SpoU
MSDTYAQDRKKIYSILAAQGMDVLSNVDLHNALKQALVEYVEHKTKNLQFIANEYNLHQKKCALFLARRQARLDRKKTVKNVLVKTN